MPRADAGARVAVLGASTNEERYSFKAVQMLKEHGFSPVPVHPAGHVVINIQAVKSLEDITGEIDTLTMYVGEKISSQQFDNILELNPRRVIFNPGAENKELAEKLRENGIEVVEACTLVMLRTEQF